MMVKAMNTRVSVVVMRQSASLPPIQFPMVRPMPIRNSVDQEQRISNVARGDVRDLIQKRRDIGEDGKRRSGKHDPDAERDPDRQSDAEEFA
ncbi:hypothetical protein Aam_041_024 [Acidocella aminolytica 101 = DSM 11237]|uniref:Uncharacterized protein n=1 Tax=Acidocella aminolytica 101 = DSM 11237 TaxID=1120923 RepID=A0A0D6PF19_9PROT|nr:hypothetical protein Aam_041_024 [Acidocella aminolytica 101 = DSM 11237]